MSGNLGDLLKSCMPNLGLNPVSLHQLYSQGTVICKKLSEWESGRVGISGLISQLFVPSHLDRSALLQ